MVSWWYLWKCIRWNSIRWSSFQWSSTWMVHMNDRWMMNGWIDGCIFLPSLRRYLHGDKPLSRFIDDKYGFWVCNECKDWRCCHHWQSFKQDLNNFGVLKWTIEDPSKQVVRPTLETLRDEFPRVLGNPATTYGPNRPRAVFLSHLDISNAAWICSCDGVG